MRNKIIVISELGSPVKDEFAVCAVMNSIRRKEA